MPTVSLKKSVTRPLKPNVARNAKASMTPPNWASTPDAATEIWRSTPPGPPADTAQASRPPKIAPMRAETSGQLDRPSRTR